MYVVGNCKDDQPDYTLITELRFKELEDRIRELEKKDTPSGSFEFPKGHVYLTLSEDDPNTQFPGVWQKLPDGVFLRNAGGNADSIGMLQNDMVGEHAHDVIMSYAQAAGWQGGSGGSDALNKSAGNGHNIRACDVSIAVAGGVETRPVNIAVHMWQRVS